MREIRYAMNHSILCKFNLYFPHRQSFDIDHKHTIKYGDNKSDYGIDSDDDPRIGSRVDVE